MQSRLRPCSNLSKNLQVKKSGDAISMAGENICTPFGIEFPNLRRSADADEPYLH